MNNIDLVKEFVVSTWDQTNSFDVPSTANQLQLSENVVRQALDQLVSEKSLTRENDLYIRV